MWKHNLNKYLDKIQTMGKNETNIRFITYGFYNMKYNFSLDYPDKVVATFDLFPLFYLVDYDHKNRCFVGINFHHMPVKIREWFLKMAFKGLSLQRLSVFVAKHLLAMKYWRCVRKYKYTRVEWLRSITLDDASELIMWASNTYLYSSYSDMTRRFNSNKVTYRDVK